MTISERMLIGSIASNPGNYAGPGEYRSRSHPIQEDSPGIRADIDQAARLG